MQTHTIAPVTTADLPDLLVLMRAYCDFYDTHPGDDALLELSGTLIADPRLEGVQVIARDAAARAAGFATVFWSWDTTEANRIGIMNDLYVALDARGSGLAERLIAECVAQCRRRGASTLHWQTGPENLRAQTVYDRVGGLHAPWLNYSLAVSSGDSR